MGGAGRVDAVWRRRRRKGSAETGRSEPLSIERISAGVREPMIRISELSAKRAIGLQVLESLKTILFVACCF